MTPEKMWATVLPVAQENHSPDTDYRAGTVMSRTKSTATAHFLKERLEAGIWDILCLLQGAELAETDRAQGWGLFESYLQRYIAIIHGGEKL